MKKLDKNYLIAFYAKGRPFYYFISEEGNTLRNFKKESLYSDVLVRFGVGKSEIETNVGKKKLDELNQFILNGNCRDNLFSLSDLELILKDNK